MPFRAHGTVVEDETGRPLEGLVVRAYDLDTLADDFLGETHTDAEGRFEVVFTEVDFMDAFETRPDVYVRVFDSDGKRLLESLEGDVRRNTLTDRAVRHSPAASASRERLRRNAGAGRRPWKPAASCRRPRERAMVEPSGIEPPTSALRTRRSPN